MSDIVIVSAARTPVGSFNGSFSNITAADLGSIVIKEVLNRAKIKGEDVSEVIMGQVLTASCGQNPARQASIKAGVPQEITAFTINQVCGSGLRSVALGLQSIINNEAEIIVAGGQENMTQAPHCFHLRQAGIMGDTEMIDSMIKDGIWDIFNGYHMGVTAENVAEKWQITRDQQDEMALNSQHKAEEAQKNGKFQKEIVSVSVQLKTGTVVVRDDEYPRHGCTLENLKNLKPAFKKDGTVTAGNASGINDGAAAVVLMKLDKAEKLGIKPIAKIASWATAGVDPAVMGSGPIPASKKALDKAKWKPSDLDLIEANEAFAAQACAVNKEMGWDPEKVNVNGGSIAIGHPIGASGTRILNTLLHEMEKRESKKGLATLCIGGGMGIAMCVERI
ncbi:MAG: Acetyl-CoA acetyltransferase [Alphaproteobacteria bacterium MarineAlpha6_Bin2]|nr:MAG: Acetyl-CoA acetyltransferase [Alphaproteobacteria bacterium MarineAlpha6_Bin2]